MNENEMTTDVVETEVMEIEEPVKEGPNGVALALGAATAGLVIVGVVTVAKKAVIPAAKKVGAGAKALKDKIFHKNSDCVDADYVDIPVSDGNEKDDESEE